MMNTKQTLLWRAEWYHRSGYQAPYQLIVAETTKGAHKVAQQSSRLADFPKVWSYRLFAVIVEKKKSGPNRMISQEVTE